MLGRVIALLGLLTACDPPPRASMTMLRSSLASRDVIDFTVNGEAGAQGNVGPTGVTGRTGPNAPQTGLNAGCTRLKVRGGAGGPDIACGSGGGEEVTFAGSTNGLVSGTEAVVAPSGTFTAEAWSGAAGTPAVVAENVAGPGPALRALGGADFRSAQRVELPMRWIGQNCGDAPSGEVGTNRVCECTCFKGDPGCTTNNCTAALAVCDPDEIVISGACRVGGGLHIRNACSSTSTTMTATCSESDTERSFLCESDGVDIVRAWALCMKMYL